MSNNQTLSDFQIESNEMFERLSRESDQILYWHFGIRNSQIFRQDALEFLWQEYNAPLQERLIEGQVFNFIVADGRHMLVEIVETAGRKTQERLERKRKIFADETGIEPAKILLFPEWINSVRAQTLIDAGIDVIQLEPPELEAKEN